MRVKTEQIPSIYKLGDIIQYEWVKQHGFIKNTYYFIGGISMNRNMNNAKNIIETLDAYNKTVQSLSLGEFLLAQSIVVDGVMDKDLNTEDMPEMVYTINSGWQKSKKYNHKHILKDKAKAGLKDGSKWSGWGRYDRFGLDEHMSHDIKRDIKVQLDELDNIDLSVFDAEEISLTLLIVIGKSIYRKGMNKVWFHMSEDFKDMTHWATIIDQFKADSETTIHEAMQMAYNIVDEDYPEVPMSIRNEAVDMLMDTLKDDLNYTLKSMMDYCVRCWKEVNFPEF